VLIPHTSLVTLHPTEYISSTAIELFKGTVLICHDNPTPKEKIKDGLPSGKCLHNYGKSPFSMGKSTISMAMEKIGYGKSPVFLRTQSMREIGFRSDVK